MVPHSKIKYDSVTDFQNNCVPGYESPTVLLTVRARLFLGSMEEVAVPGGPMNVLAGSVVACVGGTGSFTSQALLLLSLVGLLSLPQGFPRMLGLKPLLVLSADSADFLQN